MAGCGYEILQRKDQLLVNARYAELEQHMEAQVPQLAGAMTDKLFPLCLAYSKVKRYNKLFPCLDQLEANVRRGDRIYVMGQGGFAVRSDIARWPYVLRAEAHLELGAYGRTIDEAVRADGLSARSPRGGQFFDTVLRIQTLALLSLAHAFTGERVKAAAYRDQLKDVPIELWGHGVTGPEKRNALAKVHLALGEYEAALGYVETDFMSEGYQRLLDTMVGASTRGESISSFVELPRLYMRNKCLLELGRVDEAKAGYDKLLGVRQIAENGELYWLILFDRGRIAEQEGNRDEAIRFYERAIEVIEQQRSTINTEASKIGFIGNKQAVYRHAVAALFATGQHGTAFEYVERAKSRALVDLLASKRDFAVPMANVEQVRALLARMESAEREARVQTAQAEVEQTRSVAVRTREQLRSQAPELASLVSVSHATVPEIRALVPGDETLVEYYYDEAGMFAFVLTGTGLHGVRLDAAGLVEEIRGFRELLEQPGASPPTAVARSLYRHLVQPLEPLIAGQRLLIVPHGALHYLPFNALHDGTDYLVERYSIRLLPSATVLKYLRAGKVEQPGGLLAFGNPDLGDRRLDLAHAQAEAVAVSQLAPRSRALLRSQATKGAFKRFGGGFAYIHFATHGRFDADAPLESAILLARDADEDGTLTVDELYSLRLGAELVTLSACETGLGKVFGGDDVVGLTRGFLYAGARAIVASLWKVEDQATAELMKAFYARLEQGDKREALRQAQLEVKRTHPHPFYWAAFQLTGNPR